MEITGRNIVITGGGRGLGRQFAADLRELGANPFALDVVEKNLGELKRDAGVDGRVVDVTDEKEVGEFFEWYTEEYGPPDVLINNAGITADSLLVKKSGEKVRTFSLSNWEKVLNVNLTGVFLCGREAAARMVKHGVKGLIINISSISRSGNLGQTNYSAAKSGVAAMTVTWAKELARYGVRSAAIAPGYVNTEMVAKINRKIIEKIVAEIPVGRLGEMAEISRAVQFIIECDYFNGRVLEVDGGHRI
ncbi:MAG: SDR family oxidoreductase [Desulfobacterales bacterium]|nr:SDR family oxidoreductase [Desulfobacterales bacterium]